MEYEDTRTIATPEGVELELRLAGLGSRFSAGLIDLTIKGVLVVGFIFAVAALADGTVAAVLAGAGFLFASVVFDVLFEVRSGGRTPGKRVLGLRVTMADGRPVGLRASTTRNVLRLFEGFPLSYVPAIICILVTRSNQRLGDLAAGTVVVHERALSPSPSFAVERSVPEHAAGWDVSAITPEELAAVRSFLGRRHDFSPAAREDLAKRLADRLRPRVGGAPEGSIPERFLEDLERVKSSKR